MKKKGKTRPSYWGRVHRAKHAEYAETPYWILIISNMDALAISITKDRRRKCTKS